MDIAGTTAEAVERDENNRNDATFILPTFYTESSDNIVIDTQPPLSNNDNLGIENGDSDNLMDCCLCGGCYNNSCGCFDCGGDGDGGDCCGGGDGGDCCGGGGDGGDCCGGGGGGDCCGGGGGGDCCGGGGCGDCNIS